MYKVGDWLDTDGEGKPRHEASPNSVALRAKGREPDPYYFSSNMSTSMQSLGKDLK